MPSLLRRASLALTALGALAGTLALTAVPALAAPLETPESGKANPATITATTARLEDGILNPKAATDEPLEYQYVYLRSASACEGEAELFAPEVAELLPGIAPGEAANPQELTGLSPGTKYTFCLLARNAAEPAETATGAPVTFKTLAVPPTIPSEFSTKVTGTSASLGAMIDPGGAETTYRFEYLSEAEFVANGGSFTGADKPVVAPQPDGVSGSDDGEHLAQVLIEGLTPSTSYHYRVLASNHCKAAEPAVLCTAEGERNSEGEEVAHTFTTQGAQPASSLIDGRSWELVSPPAKHGSLLGVNGSTEGGGLVQAAQDGGGLAYFANAPVGTHPEGNRSFAFTQLLSRREAPGVWGTQELNVPHEEVQGIEDLSEFKLFSSDLSTGLIEPEGGALLSAKATEQTPYLREGGEYLPLLPAPLAEPASGVIPGAGTVFVTATPNLSHVLIGPGAGSRGELYEWTAGTLQQVSILPDGKPAGQEGLTPRVGAENVGVRNAITTDGNRVIFETESQSGAHARDLYLRDLSLNQTVQLDLPEEGVINPGQRRGGFPRYLDASSDASKVFFTDVRDLTTNATATRREPDLYMCDVAAIAPGEPDCRRHLSDLTVPIHANEHGNLQGVDVGIGQDGRYVYFVATGELAPGATPEPCVNAFAQPTGATCNLYVRDTVSGQTRLIARLSGDDAPDWLVSEDDDYGSLTARVSPDGRWLAFMSQESLTWYDNRDAVSGQPDQEVFLYHAPENLAGEPGSLTCVSCNPTGARPHGVFDPPFDEPPFPPQLLVDERGNWGGHWLAGSLPGWNYVSTTEALYQPRYLSNGGRVFLTAPPPCTTTDSCRAAPAPEPDVFGAPASATFHGPGNLTPTAPAVVKPPVKKKTVKCPRGKTRNRKGRCVRKPRKGKGKK